MRGTKGHTSVRTLLRAGALLLVPVLVATAAGSASAVPTRHSPRPTALQQRADALRDAGAIGVLADSVTPAGHFAVRSGVSDWETNRPVSFDSSFRVGFVTQTFVSTVVLQLAGEGKLSLDDTVERWLPGVVAGNGNDGSTITIRNLLLHNDGLVDAWQIVEVPSMNTTENYAVTSLRTWRPAELVAIATQHPPDFAPGADWAFNVTGYILLGMIIQRVTGHSWATEVTSRIIRPLRLSDTYVPGAFPYIAGPHPHAYSRLGLDVDMIDVTVLNPTVANSAGAMISTPGDISRFMTALIKGRLLRPAQLAEMTTTIPAPWLGFIWSGARYGLGLAWIPLSCGGGYWASAGNLPGWQTQGGVLPNGRRTVIVANTGEVTLATMQAAGALVDQQMCASN